MLTSQFFWFVLALGLTLLGTPRLARWLTDRKVSLTNPRPRDVHAKPIPRLGGVVIAVVFWLITSLLLVTNPERLHFVDQMVLGIDRNLLGVLLGSAILVIVGTVDDLRGVRPGWKLVWQIVAAAMLPIFGIQVQHLANPLGGLNIELAPVIDAILAIAWVVLVVNVINFLDGLDGLATGVASIALATLYFLALAPFVNQPALALLLLILLGATLGFLPWNWHPAKIFLGDSGSQLIGYLIAVAAIVSGGKLATAALVLSLPILDALWTIVRRLLAGQSPFKADRRHLHHRLFDLGLSQPVVVLILMTITVLFGIIALSARTTGKVEAFLLATVLMAAILISLSLWEGSKRPKVEGKR